VVYIVRISFLVHRIGLCEDNRNPIKKMERGSETSVCAIYEIYCY
jgi:hypothetical protein